MSLVGENDRFLVGSSLSVVGEVTNTTPNANTLKWQITSQSPGLSLTPASQTGLPAGDSTTLAGTVTGAAPGTQDAMVTVSALGTTSQVLNTSTSHVQIDPVSSRGIDSVTAANLGRIMQGASTSATVSVASAGARSLYSDLTVNGGATAAASDANGSYTVTNGAAVTFNGTTTTDPNVTVSATFGNAASGPISGTAAVPGNTGLFTGETLAAGTPVLPTLDVPYSATVLQQRQLSPATGTAANPITVPAPPAGFCTAPSCRSLPMR